MIWNFVIGGVAGWLLANLMESDDAAEEAEVTSEQALEVLIRDIRDEAQSAMDECTTDEEREMVYEQVKESVLKFQVILEEQGEKIIADLRAQVADNHCKEEKADPMESRLHAFKEKMENLSDMLNQAISDLKSASA